LGGLFHDARHDVEVFFQLTLRFGIKFAGADEQRWAGALRGVGQGKGRVQFGGGDRITGDFARRLSDFGDLMFELALDLSELLLQLRADIECDVFGVRKRGRLRTDRGCLLSFGHGCAQQGDDRGQGDDIDIWT
jgi:hypothetical protein